MKQSITWSTSVKVITALSLLLIIGAGLAVIITAATTNKGVDAYIIGIVLLIIPPLTFLFSPTYLEIDDKQLTIHKVMGKKRINRADIESVHTYSRSMSNIRTFGSGGLFGYFGRFHNSSHGHYTAYVGDIGQAFYITTKSGKTYLVSCKNREEFIKSINEHKDNAN